ncbi:prepilin peptidase [Vibrio sp. D404a]|uniref:A24 family peptidase n=1 Tax=unclassified Vibrio TaxID=2614977 RepID=UPI002553E01A|nr:MULTISPECIES: prepilin peptidase [unclassified Vibrio]MDK9738699.1 prepilin peptidase [Vibrio sp. D404a]MDK9795489.1 prepilin peptidase [Vibrio sp. D449a]
MAVQLTNKLMIESIITFKLFIWGLFLILMSICYFDIRKRKIPNTAVFLLLIFLIISTLVYEINIYYISFFITLFICFTLWMLGIWGAGDVKLLTVLSLFISPGFLFASILVVLVVGGVAALCEYLTTKVIPSRKSKGVPYGVAICVGGCVGILASMGQ